MDYPFENGLDFNDNGYRTQDNTTPSMDIAISKLSSSQVNSSCFQKKEEDFVEVFLPILTVSEANGGVKKTYYHRGKKCYKSEDYHDKARRHRLQKQAVYLSLRPVKQKLILPLRIILTRYAPRKLNKFDNLPMSLKFILDAICEVITGDYRPGRADDDIEDSIEVVYRQVITENYGVQLRIERM